MDPNRSGYDLEMVAIKYNTMLSCRRRTARRSAHDHNHCTYLLTYLHYYVTSDMCHVGDDVSQCCVLAAFY